MSLFLSMNIIAIIVSALLYSIAIYRQYPPFIVGFLMGHVVGNALFFAIVVFFFV